jgi:hypothetical protein
MYYQFCFHIVTVAVIIDYCLGLHFHLFAQINRAFTQVVSLLPF